MTYRIATSGPGIFRSPGLRGVGTIYSIYDAPPAPPAESFATLVANTVNTAADTVAETTSEEDGMSTGTKVVIGVGVLAAAVGVVYVMRKK